jgi:hypothetical protein
VRDSSSASCPRWGWEELLLEDLLLGARREVRAGRHGEGAGDGGGDAGQDDGHAVLGGGGYAGQQADGADETVLDAEDELARADAALEGLPPAGEVAGDHARPPGRFGT